MPGILFFIDKKAGGVTTGLRHLKHVMLTKIYTANGDA
ncbi:hypothetical protein W909_05440 [Dickeya zeae EC1]|nr:hypothetical protein W909_05440 [Dickeya zeae EC1]